MTSPAVQAFGCEVKRRRLAKGLSLEALAEGAGLTSVYVHQVEEASRPRGVSLDAALRIAKGLGVDLADLLGDSDITGLGYEAARLVEALPERTQEAALAVLRALREEVTR